MSFKHPGVFSTQFILVPVLIIAFMTVGL